MIPPLFAKLFIAHATWTFAAETIDEQGPDRSVTKGEVTCTVEHVKKLKGGWSAELTCGGMPNADLASGRYIATADGLWRADVDFNGDVTKLDPDEMLIAATPKPRRHTWNASPDGGEETILVKRHAGAWCFAHMSSLGDEGGWMLCIDAKHGLVGGNGFFAGGATHDTYFGKTPRY